MATKGHIVEDRSYGELIGESKELQVLSRGGSLDDGEMREYKKEKRGGSVERRAHAGDCARKLFPQDH